MTAAGFHRGEGPGSAGCRERVLWGNTEAGKRLSGWLPRKHWGDARSPQTTQTAGDVAAGRARHTGRPCCPLPSPDKWSCRG